MRVPTLLLGPALATGTACHFGLVSTAAPSPADKCHLGPVPAPSHPRLQAAGGGALPCHLPGLVETPVSGPQDAHRPQRPNLGGLGPAEAHAGWKYEEALGLEPSSAGTCDMGPPGVSGGAAGHLLAIPPPPLSFSRPPCPHSLGRDWLRRQKLSPSAQPFVLPGQRVRLSKTRGFIPSKKGPSPWGGGDPEPVEERPAGPSGGQGEGLASAGGGAGGEQGGGGQGAGSSRSSLTSFGWRVLHHPTGWASSVPGGGLRACSEHPGPCGQWRPLLPRRLGAGQSQLCVSSALSGGPGGLGKRVCREVDTDTCSGTTGGSLLGRKGEQWARGR